MKFFDKNKDLGILILRIGVGLSFILVHGLPKITGGPEFWTRLGGAMGNLGITFAPNFWGLMSAFAEFGGGILILLGLFTRPAAAFMAFNMFVATLSHFVRLDPWGRVITPIELGSVFLGLIFIGAGKYSLDYIISKRKETVKLTLEHHESVINRNAS
jgi:putative oxidoreductase